MTPDRDALRGKIAYSLKCWLVGQPQMGVDWTHPQNRRFLEQADAILALIEPLVGAGDEATTLLRESIARCGKLAISENVSEADCLRRILANQVAIMNALIQEKRP